MEGCCGASREVPLQKRKKEATNIIAVRMIRYWGISEPEIVRCCFCWGSIPAFSKTRATVSFVLIVLMPAGQLCRYSLLPVHIAADATAVRHGGLNGYEGQ
jgi:hypothetical protein